MSYQKKNLPSKIYLIGFILFLIGGGLSALAFSVDLKRAYMNYIVMYMFVVSVAVGSLGVVAIEYMSGAIWSTPFRRVSEFLAGIIFILIILVIPILFGIQDIFKWSHSEIVMKDEIIKSKSAYLNKDFFIIRSLACIVIWIFFYLLLFRNSKKQDTTKDVKYTLNNNKISVIFAPFGIVTLTIAAIDFMMSLEPHWYSTIYGVYYFAGSLIAGFTSLALTSILLLENGYLDSRMSKRHYHSLGTLIFGLNIFWAYIAFSQFLLIWYADIPEETFWLIPRLQGGWGIISLLLLFVHFIIPFLILLPSTAKTNLKTLKIMSVWLLFAHWLDLFWLVMPNYSKDSVPLNWIELAFPVTAVGLILIVFKFIADRNNLIPVGDPKLENGINLSLYPDLSID